MSKRIRTPSEPSTHTVQSRESSFETQSQPSEIKIASLWAPPVPGSKPKQVPRHSTAIPVSPSPASTSSPVEALVVVPLRVPPMHSTSPSIIEGGSLTQIALEHLGNIEMSKLGTTTISLPQPDGTTKSFTVRDMQYELGDGKIGMRLIAVEDMDPAANAQMDALIRRESGIGPDDPIYSLIAYIHPEEHTATIDAAALRLLKPEMGSTHMGTYLGEGNTSNAEENYHNKTWGVDEGKPYPANVQIVSMEGVSQAELNKSLVAVDAVLNKGVIFPPDYKNDPLLTPDLNSTLMFYRDWIKKEPYTREDSDWATYCAEHKLIVLNAAMNVPNNVDSFKEVFGNQEGAELFAAFKARFEEAKGRPFTKADETYFEPLWKKEGLTAAQIRPPRKSEYDDYQKARADGSLANGMYSGYKPLPAGKGMTWRPETISDLVKNFMETYAPFNQVGGYVSAASLLGFREMVMKRTGIDEKAFMSYAMPVLSKVMIAEGMARAPSDPAQFKKWVTSATGGLYVAFGGRPADLAPGGKPQAELMSVAKAVMEGPAAASSQIQQAAALPEAQRNDLAYGWMRGAINADLERARLAPVAQKSIEYYAPPAMTNRVVNGILEKSKFVNVRIIATAIAGRHLVKPE